VAPFETGMHCGGVLTCRRQMVPRSPASAAPNEPAFDDTEAVLSPEEHARWWDLWVEQGPKGPIVDDADDELPADP